MTNLKSIFAALSLLFVASVAGAGTFGGSSTSAPITDAGALSVRELGWPSAAQRCYEATCAPGGDGGLLGATTMATWTATDASWPAGADAAIFQQYGDAGTGSNLAVGSRYILTVTTGSAVRLRNGGPCAAFAGGTGRIVNEGATLDWTAQAAPDGGVPLYACCAQTAGAVVQLCSQD